MKAAWAVVLLLVPFLAHPVSAEHVEGPPAPLYLLPQEAGIRNFTTHPPTATEAVLVEPHMVVQPFFYWDWQTDRSPAAWTLSPDDLIDATLYFEGLDRVIPYNSRGDPTERMKIRIGVDLFIHGDLYRGLTPWDSWVGLMAEENSNATGEVFIDPPLLMGDGDLEVTVPLTVREAQSILARSTVAIRVSVSGIADAEERPNLRVGAMDSASRIVIGGFPMAGFEAWEEETIKTRECNERILRGEPCNLEDVAGPPGEPSVEQAPGPFPLLVFVLLLVFLRTQVHPRRISNGVPTSSMPRTGPKRI